LRPDLQARRHALGCLWAAAALALAGCATLPPQAALERVHSGRFAATTTLDDRRENSSGRFTLSVGGDRLVLDLSSPVGTTLARIDVGAQGATLRTADNGATRQGRDAEALALEVLGWPLPAAGIGDWIEGWPAPGRPSRATERDGAVAAIEQDGWTIEIAERFAAGSPRRIVISRPALGEAPAITLRLVLDEPVATAAR
jgi:outer membrane lipoprotein LolB